MRWGVCFVFGDEEKEVKDREGTKSRTWGGKGGEGTWRQNCEGRKKGAGGG